MAGGIGIQQDSSERLNITFRSPTQQRNYGPAHWGNHKPRARPLAHRSHSKKKKEVVTSSWPLFRPSGRSRQAHKQRRKVSSRNLQSSRLENCHARAQMNPLGAG